MKQLGAHHARAQMHLNRQLRLGGLSEGQYNEQLEQTVQLFDRYREYIGMYRTLPPELSRTKPDKQDPEQVAMLSVARRDAGGRKGARSMLLKRKLRNGVLSQTEHDAAVAESLRMYDEEVAEAARLVQQGATAEEVKAGMQAQSRLPGMFDPAPRNVSVKVKRSTASGTHKEKNAAEKAAPKPRRKATEASKDQMMAAGQRQNATSSTSAASVSVSASKASASALKASTSGYVKGSSPSSSMQLGDRGCYRQLNGELVVASTRRQRRPQSSSTPPSTSYAPHHTFSAPTHFSSENRRTQPQPLPQPLTLPQSQPGPREEEEQRKVQQVHGVHEGRGAMEMVDVEEGLQGMGSRIKEAWAEDGLEGGSRGPLLRGLNGQGAGSQGKHDRHGGHGWEGLQAAGGAHHCWRTQQEQEEEVEEEEGPIAQYDGGRRRPVVPCACPDPEGDTDSACSTGAGDVTQMGMQAGTVVGGHDATPAYAVHGDPSAAAAAAAEFEERLLRVDLIRSIVPRMQQLLVLLDRDSEWYCRFMMEQERQLFEAKMRHCRIAIKMAQEKLSDHLDLLGLGEELLDKAPAVLTVHIPHSHPPQVDSEGPVGDTHQDASSLASPVNGLFLGAAGIVDPQTAATVQHAPRPSQGDAVDAPRPDYQQGFEEWAHNLGQGQRHEQGQQEREDSNTKHAVSFSDLDSLEALLALSWGEV